MFSLGAGVDHLMGDPQLPAVPMVRVVDDDLTNRMSEYVVLHCLMHLRRQRAYDAQQRQKLWLDDRFQPGAHHVRVGIMGLGVLGQDAARKLAVMGFDVAGWSRSPRSVEGMATFSGADGPRPLPRPHRHPGLPVAADAGHARHPEPLGLRAPRPRRASRRAGG